MNKVIMRNLLSIILLSAFISSCGDSQITDKEKQLADLIKQQTEINEKVRILREEIKKASGDQAGVKLVEIKTPEKQVFKHYVEIQAKVDGDESVTISSRTQGVVTAIMVNEGDKVTKDQVLATLDDQIIQQSLAEVETQYNFANNIYEKQKNLWDQKIGSEVQYLTAKNNKESLEKRLASIREQLDLTKIRSPFSGTVDNVNIKIGQSLMPGVPAFSVVNLNKLKVEGEVGESYSGKINKGDEVVLYFPDLQKEIPSKVGFASKMINTLNRTFNVEVPLSGDNSGLSPNMVVVMKIVDYSNNDAFILPIDLLQQSADGNYIMVAEISSNSFVSKRKPVVTGLTYNGFAEILSGVNENDQIITNGYRDLNDGQEIRIK